MRKIQLIIIIIIAIAISCSKPSQLQIAKKQIEDIVMLKQYDNPRSFKNEAYCYYVYQGVLDPVKITPELFAKFVKGGSLSTSYLAEYNKWLERENGSLCRQIIGDGFARITDDPKKKYVIFLNNFAIKDDGKNPQVSKSHELLHVAFSLYKKNRDRIEKSWNLLSDDDKKKFKESYPGYNFNNHEVLLREYFSYTYQGDFEKGLKFLIE